MSAIDYILGRARFRVTAAVVVARATTGSETYVYRGGVIPEDTEPHQIQTLLNSGMIERIGEPA